MAWPILYRSWVRPCFQSSAVLSHCIIHKGPWKKVTSNSIKKDLAFLFKSKLPKKLIFREFVMTFCSLPCCQTTALSLSLELLLARREILALFVYSECDHLSVKRQETKLSTCTKLRENWFSILYLVKDISSLHFVSYSTW